MFIPTVCKCDPHTIIWYDYSHLCVIPSLVCTSNFCFDSDIECVHVCTQTDHCQACGILLILIQEISVWMDSIPSSAFQLTWVVKFFNFKCICCQIYMLENSVLFTSCARKFIDWQLIKTAGTIIIISLMGTIQHVQFQLSGDVSRHPWPKVSG